MEDIKKKKEESNRKAKNEREKYNEIINQKEQKLIE